MPPDFTFTQPSRACDICGLTATGVHGQAWGRDTYCCDEHSPMRWTAGALPPGFWFRSLTPLPLAVPHTTGHLTMGASPYPVITLPELMATTTAGSLP
jgi:hypothetical protein